MRGSYLWCARGVGIEKSLVVRGGIERVHYSQKSIRVDYVYGVGLAGSESHRTCRGAGVSLPNIDGNSPTERTLSASAPGTDDGGNLTSQAVEFRNGTKGGAGGESDSGKTKGPDRVVQSSPFGQFVFAKNGGISSNFKTIVPLTFPNIAHDYWENYRLTSEYYIRRSNLSSE